MNYINDFEEAKKYLESDIDGVYDRYLRKTAWRNALIIGGGGSAVFLLIAAVSRHYEFAAFIAAMLAWSLSAFTGLIKRKTDVMLIRKGTYFQTRGPADVIAQANRQIDITNRYS